MSTVYGVRQTKVFSANETAVTGQAIDSTGDKVFWTPGQPVTILRWGVITYGTLTIDSGACDISLDHRPIAGADTNRVEVSVMSLLDGDDDTVSQVFYHDMDPASTVDPVPGPLKVLPGEQVVFEVTDAAGAGDGYFFVEYLCHPFVGGSEDDANSDIYLAKAR